MFLKKLENLKFDDALTVIRRELPNDLIWNAFLFEGNWIFSVTDGKTFDKDNLSGFFVSVDAQTRQLKGYPFLTDFKGADSDLIWIDVKKEDIEKER